MIPSRTVYSATLVVCLLAPTAHTQVVDFSGQTMPTCEIAGLAVAPPGGWFSVPFEDPPEGHLGCQMMRTNEREELVGIIRVRSVMAPAREFTDEGHARYIGNEALALEQMGYTLADEPLWVRDDVPVKGAGFREGRAVGVAAHIAGNDVPQEAHFLVFRTDSTKYLFTLLTPAQAHDETLHRRNTADFGLVIRTLKPRGD